MIAHQQAFAGVGPCQSTGRLFRPDPRRLYGLGGWWVSLLGSRVWIVRARNNCGLCELCEKPLPPPAAPFARLAANPYNLAMIFKRRHLPDPDEVRMSLGDHVEELRSCLLRALIGVGVCLVGTFIYGFQLINWLAQPLFQAQKAYDLPVTTIVTEATAGFTSVYLPVTIIAAVVIASPWVVYQIWRFIVVGLYEHERKVVYVLAPFSATMTALAVLFTYYILLPVCLMFFLRWSTYYPEVHDVRLGFMARIMAPPSQIDPESIDIATKPMMLPVLLTEPEPLREGMIWIQRDDMSVRMFVGGSVRIMALYSNRTVTPLPSTNQFVRFAAFLGLGIVLAFQLPVIMLVTGWMQVFDPYELAKFRKYAFFACMIVGAILTPTDLISMFVLAMPLYLLFEFGLILMKWSWTEPDVDDADDAAATAYEDDDPTEPDADAYGDDYYDNTYGETGPDAYGPDDAADDPHAQTPDTPEPPDATDDDDAARQAWADDPYVDRREIADDQLDEQADDDPHASDGDDGGDDDGDKDDPADAPRRDPH